MGWGPDSNTIRSRLKALEYFKRCVQGSLYMSQLDMEEAET